MKEISISTSTYQKYNAGKNLQRRSLEETVRFLHSVGFRYLDVGLSDYKNREDILWAEDWQDQIANVAQLCRNLGMTCYQGHTPFFPKSMLSTFPSQQALEDYKEYFRRSLIAASMLGIRWMVVHPITCKEENFEWRATLDANHRFWDPLIEVAMDRNVGIAYENQLPYLDRNTNFRSFCHYEELIALIDSYNDPQRIGACWDTGHANQSSLEQYRALKAVGSRLKVLHLNDNHYGTKDEHLLPWMGEVDWDRVIQALVEVDFPGTLNHEVGKVTTFASGKAQQELVRMSYNNALYFQNAYEQERIRQGKA